MFRAGPRAKAPLLHADKQSTAPPRRAADFSPYFPRLAVAWAEDDPDQAWREIDASLVFVDISGFTALSERLARRGHVGAEELTQTLSTCFADLLVAAYADGGSLVKFGGDALLLLFDGDAHAERAVRSALQMRARLGRSGRIATSVGTIGLRLSAGVHSGAVHLFRVGGSHHELLIAGPGPTGVVAMEQVATAGQVVVSAATAQRIPPKLIGQAAGPGWLLRARPRVASDASFPPPPSPSDADLTTSVPVALRDFLGASVEPEHRQVTVGFIRFEGVDDVIANEGAPAAAVALDELVRDVQTAVDDEQATFLGSDADGDGGKLIVVGGAPTALDDGEGRVLRAMRRVIDGTRRLPVRVGVHRGHAFVGEVGPPYRRTYTVMGDTVNLAARLMASAAPGELRATAEVLDSAASEFDTTALPPFFVKGKSRPVEAFLVGERVRRRTRAVTDLPFVGRAAEREALSAALDNMRHGSGGLVDIAGAAGIGKSRLLREFLAVAADVPVVTAYCETYEAKTPYFAARYLVRGALGITTSASLRPGPLRAAVAEAAPDLIAWLPLIGAVVDIDVPATVESASLEPQFRREQTARVIVDLLDGVVAHHQLFVVEDAQWVDELSTELLVAIAKRARTRPWLVCVVRRGERGGFTPGDETTTQLTLAPLADADARALLQRAAGETLLRPDQTDALVARAGGNPLFVEQLARAAASGTADDAAMSGSLESVVAAQIDTLPAQDRLALRYAAVLGPMFETERLAELVADAGGDPRATPRRLRAFIESAGPGLLRFRNQLYREVAYQTLSFRRRKELHGRAGAAIEAAAASSLTDRSEILSFHYLHAQEYEKCWDYALAAAARARAKFANVEAAALYERALVAGTQLGDGVAPPLAAVYESLGEVALHGGLFELAKTAFTRARTLLAGQTFDVARLSKLESLIAMHRGQATNALRWINRGLRLLEGRDDVRSVGLRAEVRQLRAEQLQRLRQNRKALEWAELAIADALASDNRQALARAYSVADLALFDLGRTDEATHLVDALQIWVDLGELREQATVLTLLGATAYWKGEWDDALDYFSRGRDAYTKAGDLVSAGYGTTNAADILLDQGRADEVTGLEEVIGLWRSVGHPDPVSGALTNLGRCALQRGGVVEARQLFDEARRAVEDLGGNTAENDAWIAECLLREGETANALGLVDRCMRAEQTLGSTMLLARLHRLRGYALAAAGDYDGAVGEFEQAISRARERAASYEIALGLEGLVAVLAASGVPVDDVAETERDQTFARLGVRATFAPNVFAVVGGLA